MEQVDRVAERKGDNRRIALANATTLVAQGVTVDGAPDPIALAEKMFEFLEGGTDGER